jgi:biotin carboxyl carrier protein
VALNRYAVTIDGRTRAVEVEDVEGKREDGADGRAVVSGGVVSGGVVSGGKVRVRVDGHARELDARDLGGGAWSLLDGREARLVQVDGAPDKLTVEVSHPDGEPRSCLVSVSVSGADGAGTSGEAPGVGASAGRAAGPLTMRAPIPGKVVKVLVKAGERVAAGQALLVLEAMKMENELRTPRAGGVVIVHVKEGTAVEAGQDLLTLD